MYVSEITSLYSVWERLMGLQDGYRIVFVSQRPYVTMEQPVSEQILFIAVHCIYVWNYL